MIFFTADTHFGHANILKLCGRPFDTIEEMNEVMIGKWNDRVKGTDTVYIVGDMFFRCSDAEIILRHHRTILFVQLRRQKIRQMKQIFARVVTPTRRKFVIYDGFYASK